MVHLGKVSVKMIVFFLVDINESKLEPENI